MKYFLLLICPLYLFVSKTYAVGCGFNTVEELNNCTMDEVFFKLIPRLMPEGVQLKERESSGDTLSPYERILPPKPTLLEFQNEFIKWKEEVIEDLNFKTRIRNNKTNLRMKMTACGYSDPNTEIFLKDIYKNKAALKLDCLESKEIEVARLLLKRKAKEDEINNARQFIRGFDCTTLTGIQRAMCTSLQR